MKLVFIAGLLAGVVLFAACGGSSTKLPPGDEGEIQQLLLDFVKYKEAGNDKDLAALFSSTCEDPSLHARKIIFGWRSFTDTAKIKIESLDVKELTADHAVVLPIGELRVENEQPAAISTSDATLAKEDGVWKLDACEYDMPSLPVPIGLE